MSRIFKQGMPDIEPMTPYGPDPPDEDDDSIPLPPDSNPRPAAPVREPDDEPPPIEDPSMPEPTRLSTP